MKSSTIKTATLAVFCLGVSLAPAANAQSRDTGVGRIIAAQGNVALERIRTELRQSIQSWKPAVEAPRVVPVSDRRPADATGAGLPDSANCAP